MRGLLSMTRMPSTGRVAVHAWYRRPRTRLHVDRGLDADAVIGVVAGRDDAASERCGKTLERRCLTRRRRSAGPRASPAREMAGALGRHGEQPRRSGGRASLVFGLGHMERLWFISQRLDDGVSRLPADQGGRLCVGRARSSIQARLPPCALRRAPRRPGASGYDSCPFAASAGQGKRAGKRASRVRVRAGGSYERRAWCGTGRCKGGGQSQERGQEGRRTEGRRAGGRRARGQAGRPAGGARASIEQDTANRRGDASRARAHRLATSPHVRPARPGINPMDGRRPAQTPDS